MLIYGALFGAGKLLLHETTTGLALLAMGSGRFRHHLLQSFAQGLERGCGLE